MNDKDAHQVIAKRDKWQKRSLGNGQRLLSTAKKKMNDKKDDEVTVPERL